MGKIIEVVIPDIGSFKDVLVMAVLVKPGDLVQADDGLIILESDKATMEVPAPCSGAVTAIKVSVGNKVSEGSPILTLHVTDPTETLINTPTQVVTLQRNSVESEKARLQQPLAWMRLSLFTGLSSFFIVIVSDRYPLGESLGWMNGLLAIASAVTFCVWLGVLANRLGHSAIYWCVCALILGPYSAIWVHSEFERKVRLAVAKLRESLDKLRAEKSFSPTTTNDSAGPSRLLRARGAMNGNQQRVLFAAAAIIVVMLLFPPFHTHYRGGNIENCGYTFFLASREACTVDTSMLLVQWVAVLLVAGILWFAFRDKE